MSAPKDRWDKLDVLLRPLGGLLTALSVALVGFLGSQYLDRRQAGETNTRLYAELMSSRERADSDLRKEMFNLIISTFLHSPPGQQRDEEDEILALELLAYNFHDAIDIGPLFKHVEGKIEHGPQTQRNILRTRLEKVAREVADKQLAALEDGGKIVSADVSLEAIRASSGTEPIQLIFEPLRLGNAGSDEPNRYFTVEILEADEAKHEVIARLEVYLPDESRAEVDLNFAVSFFDFPMIDNTRLSGGQRVSVTLRRWQRQGTVKMSLAYFPASRASLKEKPYYDEIIEQLKETRRLLVETTS